MRAPSLIACVRFTEGHQVGAVLDRNGLRPSRFWVTKDGFVVLASEVGVLDIPADNIERKGRLQPGKMFLVDIEQGRIIEDGDMKMGQDPTSYVLDPLMFQDL